MHGMNVVRKAENRPDGSLQVAEVFYTLQGEGPYSGMPAVFLRLTGCNLRCWFCDTLWDDDGDLYLSHEEVVRQVIELMPVHCKLLVLTGGEPMRQRLGPFLRALWKEHADITVQIETAGTLWQEDMLASGGKLEFVVSPKTAKIHQEIYYRARAFKYIVVAGQLGDDGLPLMNTQLQGGETVKLARPRPGAEVYLSPCDEASPVSNALNMQAVGLSSLKFGYRAGVQLHKLLGLR